MITNISALFQGPGINATTVETLLLYIVHGLIMLVLFPEG